MGRQASFAALMLVSTALTFLPVYLIAQAEDTNESPDSDAPQAFTTTTTTSSEDISPLIIAGYLPEYRSYINVSEAAVHLTDLILFSIEPNEDGGIEGSCCLDEGHYRVGREAREYKQQRQLEAGVIGEELRLFVTVGGSGRSENFATVLSDDEKRENFLSELKDLCLREKLSGVDFDWELPATRSEWSAYYRLVSAASYHFHASGLLVSLAVHPYHKLPDSVCETVDRIHLMTYDMMPPLPPTGTFNLLTFHHAEYEQVVGEVKALSSRKCPSSKVVMGIPVYGRHYQNPHLVRTYSEIVDGLTAKRGGVLPSAIHTLDSADGYRFDSPADVMKKVRYAASDEGKLAGVFFWEVGQDKCHEKVSMGGILLKAASDAAKETGRWGAGGRASVRNDEL